ncbi:hypothetical protein ACJRO7_001442 [Eucalyptus globulus]|uniref:Uncharacterized protein n=1 Tax=Eucalyptus globulus TaxID=34317 RepID=A0ABD3LU70_EUCGL
MIMSRIHRAAVDFTPNSPENKPPANEKLEALTSGAPRLLVNHEDDTCSGYINYFVLRELMDSIRAGKKQKMAMRHSLLHLTTYALSKDPESEPVDILLLSNLIVNPTPSPDFRRAHSIEQWWDHPTKCLSVLHISLSKAMKPKTSEMPATKALERRPIRHV